MGERLSYEVQRLQGRSLGWRYPTPRVRFCGRMEYDESSITSPLFGPAPRLIPREPLTQRRKLRPVPVEGSVSPDSLSTATAAANCGASGRSSGWPAVSAAVLTSCVCRPGYARLSYDFWLSMRGPQAPRALNIHNVLVRFAGLCPRTD
jgi:hypothetical protein